MGIPANPSPPPLPCLYSQELQLKLYQAFIVCIPILSSIILLLLFYLFYVKRRVSTLSSPPPPLLPTTSVDTPTVCISPFSIYIYFPKQIHENVMQTNKISQTSTNIHFSAKTDIKVGQGQNKTYIFWLVLTEMWMHADACKIFFVCKSLPVNIASHSDTLKIDIGGT